MKKINIKGVMIYSDMKPEAIFNRLKNRLSTVTTIKGYIFVRDETSKIMLKFQPQNQNGVLVDVMESPITSDNTWLTESVFGTHLFSLH